jgi:hypothetical protein
MCQHKLRWSPPDRCQWSSRLHQHFPLPSPLGAPIARASSIIFCESIWMPEAMRLTGIEHKSPATRDFSLLGTTPVRCRQPPRGGAVHASSWHRKSGAWWVLAPGESGVAHALVVVPLGDWHFCSGLQNACCQPPVIGLAQHALHSIFLGCFDNMQLLRGTPYTAGRDFLALDGRFLGSEVHFAGSGLAISVPA